MLYLNIPDFASVPCTVNSNVVRANIDQNSVLKYSPRAISSMDGMNTNRESHSKSGLTWKLKKKRSNSPLARAHLCIVFRMISRTLNMCGAFNKFPDLFVQVFKIVIDSLKFSMLLLYIL